MGRLIDESELIDTIQGSEELLDFQKDECINCIKACDTAYDPDKVVTKLEYLAGLWREAGVEHRTKGIETAIKIVKGGGVDGQF